MIDQSEKSLFSISEIEDLHALFADEINLITVNKSFINKYVQHRFAQYDVSDMQDRELLLRSPTGIPEGPRVAWPKACQP